MDIPVARRFMVGPMMAIAVGYRGGHGCIMVMVINYCLGQHQCPDTDNSAF